ncbi:hypothetical protein KM043_001843 [Ampulex compressa]|nr:hypothetical protein KM043_001843 [Ampulex compressa]
MYPQFHSNTLFSFTVQVELAEPEIASSSRAALSSVACVSGIKNSPMDISWDEPFGRKGPEKPRETAEVWPYKGETKTAERAGGGSMK